MSRRSVDSGSIKMDRTDKRSRKNSGSEAVNLDSADKILEKAKGHIICAKNFSKEEKYKEAINSFLTVTDILNEGILTLDVQLTEMREKEDVIYEQTRNARQEMPADFDDYNGDKNETQRVADFIQTSIVRLRRPVYPQDVVGFDAPLMDIKNTIELRRSQQNLQFGVDLFNVFIVFGLPGLGKTKMAKCAYTMASRAGNYTFFSTSASAILSKWQGESEKKFKGLLEYAESMENSVLFLDEVDELLVTPNRNHSQTGANLKNIFLTTLDGINGGLKNTIIIGSTNRPWTIESASWSRFQKKYFIELPGKAQRQSILEIEASTRPHAINKVDFSHFADLTAGYSGRDLKNLMMEAWVNHLIEIKARASHSRIDVQNDDSRPWYRRIGERISSQISLLMESNVNDRGRWQSEIELKARGEQGRSDSLGSSRRSDRQLNSPLQAITVFNALKTVKSSVKVEDIELLEQFLDANV